MPRKRRIQPPPDPSAPPLGDLWTVSDADRTAIEHELKTLLGPQATPALLEAVIARASYYLICRALHTTHLQDLRAAHATIQHVYKDLARGVARLQALDLTTRGVMVSAMLFVPPEMDSDTALVWSCAVEAGMREWVRRLHAVCTDFPYDSLGFARLEEALNFYLNQLIHIYAHHVGRDMRITHNPYDEPPRTRRKPTSPFWQFILVCVAPFEPARCKENAFVERVRRQRKAVIRTQQVHKKGEILFEKPADGNC